MRHLIPLLLAAAIAACSAAPASDTSPLRQQYTWQEEGRSVTATLQPDLVVEFGGATLERQGAQLERRQGDAYVWRVPAADLPRLLAESDATLSPVLQDSAGGMRALPGGVIVRLPPEWSVAQTDAWLRRQDLEMRLRLPVSGNNIMVETPAGLAALETAERLSRQAEVVAATPNWWRERAPRER